MSDFVALENYLKYLYELSELGVDFVKPAQFAKRFHVSSPAVSDMLKRLSEDGVIVYEPYKGAKLTSKGQLIGQNMMRRHRIWELYLCQKLNFAWDEVHDQAEKLEHASSDILIDRLEQELGFPTHDPHGEPIPARSGSRPSVLETLPLSEAQINRWYTVVTVDDKDSAFLKHLSELEIQIGSEVFLKSIRAFDQSILLEYGQHNQWITQGVAGQIYVIEERNLDK